VLNNLSKEIRECYRHAEGCALKATAHNDEQLKQDFLDLEQRWLFLARSYEFSERLTDLTDETKRQVRRSPNARVIELPRMAAERKCGRQSFVVRHHLRDVEDDGADRR
jgi:hypothetical protein